MRDTVASIHSYIGGTYCGILTLHNGDQYDVYGSTKKEWIDEAKSLAQHLGVHIDIVNTEDEDIEGL